MTEYRKRMLLLEAAHDGLMQKAKELGLSQADLEEIASDWVKPPMSLAMVLRPINWDFVDFMDEKGGKDGSADV